MAQGLSGQLHGPGSEDTRGVSLTVQRPRALAVLIGCACAARCLFSVLGGEDDSWMLLTVTGNLESLREFARYAEDSIEVEVPEAETER